jgi:hypothetical protein
MSSLDFSLTCLHKSAVDFGLSPEKNLKLKAFEGMAGFTSDTGNIIDAKQARLEIGDTLSPSA